MNTPIVSLKDVSRTYEKGRIRAVESVTLDIFPHEFVSILGASGSGKSTLLNLMTGLERPTGGSVMFGDRQPRNKRDWCSLRSSKIGFVFQAFHLIPTLTAQQNVEVPMFGAGLSAGQREKRAAQFIEKVGLSHRASQIPSNLSGGERQRVAIARSLVNNPVLLAADEPTGNLDTTTARGIMELIESVRKEREMAVVLVTHDETVACRADRVLCMVDGCMKEDVSG